MSSLIPRPDRSSGPLADIEDLVAAMPAPDAAAQAAALARVEALGAGLGRLAELGGWLAAWRGGETQVRRPIVALYVAASLRDAGDPAAEAQTRLQRLADGGGAISAIARAQGAGVEVFDLGSARPSPDPALRAALTARECAATMAFGMEALAKGPGLLVLGDAAVGDGAPAAALAAALLDLSPPSALAEASDAIIARVRGEAAVSPLEWLRQVGGREVAALTGAMLAARTQRTPVLVDGAAALAAAVVLAALDPRALQHVRLGGAAADPWQAALAARLGLNPILDLAVAAGEGAAAAAAVGVVKLAGDLAAPTG